MALLDTLLGWALNFHPALSILILSLIISVIITLAIKLFTNQTLMKDLREELKELQKQMKELRSNPKKMARINDRFMETNMKYMSHSMKPTLFTFIPIILIFGWMNSHIGYVPLQPNIPFEVTMMFEPGISGSATIVLPEDIRLHEDKLEKDILNNKVQWDLIGEKGNYDIEIEFNGKTYSKSVIITDEPTYAPIEKSFKKRVLFFSSSEENGVDKVTLSNTKILPFVDVPVIKDIPWVSGWGWFGVYFLFSLVFSMSLRRVFKIH